MLDSRKVLPTKAAIASQPPSHPRVAMLMYTPTAAARRAPLSVTYTRCRCCWTGTVLWNAAHATMRLLSWSWDSQGAWTWHTKLLEVWPVGRGRFTGGGGTLINLMEAYKSVNLKSTSGLNWLETEPWPLNLLTKSMRKSKICARVTGLRLP